MNTIKVALVDDHVLLRKGLASLIMSQGFQIEFECDNGRHLMETIGKLGKAALPDVVLMDVNMPEVDGYEATAWMKANYPLVRVLALSMYDDEAAIIRMLKSGAKGYILKDAEPSELRTAINAVVAKGFYYSETVTGKLVHTIQGEDEESSNDRRQLLKLNEKEVEFLKLACSELTYKEIAERMFLSPRTIDGYRDQLFEKFGIKSRVGLVLFAIKNGLVRFQ
ncbi:response regulator transcription factor [Paraflavisolibacter sp. H34]|uniref:response regulator transcription factor n=1 Tax=Huijunlia imazamoxiresistens TaxID=3127457 RepID=UPI0030197A64